MGIEKERIPATNSLNEAAAAYLAGKDESALTGLMTAAEGLIRYFARLYGGGCCQEDLFQAGRVGLLKALQNYNPEKEVSFVTYASHFIMGEIRHLARKEASFYRPGCIAELQAKVDQVVEEYTKLHGNVPETEYIAHKLRIREESVVEVMKAGFVSFEEIDSSKIHSTAYETFKLPVEDKLTLYHALNKLSKIQQKVIRMLFFRDMTQQQVADKLGMSQRQVSRVKEKSVQILRDNMEDKV